MYVVEFISVAAALLVALYATSRFLLRSMARGLQLSRGYSDQFFVEMTVAVPIALFVVIGAVLVVLMTD